MKRADIFLLSFFATTIPACRQTGKMDLLSQSSILTATDNAALLKFIV